MAADHDGVGLPGLRARDDRGVIDVVLDEEFDG